MSKKKVLSKFTILCWAIFIAILRCMQPVGHGLDIPVAQFSEWIPIVKQHMTTFCFFFFLFKFVSMQQTCVLNWLLLTKKS